MRDGGTQFTLGEIVSLEYGAALPALMRSGSGYPVLGSSGVVGRHEAALVDGPAIVVGRKGSIGSVFWSPSPCWPIDTAYWVRPRHEVDLRWTYWMLQNLGLEQMDSSTGIPGLNRETAYDVSFHVPPLNEQRRIAKILDEVDEQVTRARDLRAKTENWLHAIRRRLISQQPEGELVAIGRLGRVLTGKTPEVGPRRSRGLGIPFVTPSEIVDGESVLVSTREARRGDANVVEIPRGSTLVVCIGFGAGKVGLLECDASVNQQINAVIPGEDVDPYFLFQSICEVSDKVKAASSLQVTPIINKSTFSQIHIRVPSYPRQMEVSRVLHQAHLELDQLDLSIDKAQHLKRALMDRLLTRGE